MPRKFQVKRGQELAAFAITSAGLGDVDIVADPGDEICDFCSYPEPVWAYWTEEFELPVSGNTWQAFSPDWAVCQRCAEFIEVKDWEGLWQRVFTVNPAMQGISEPEARPLYAPVLGYFIAGLKPGRERNQQ